LGEEEGLENFQPLSRGAASRNLTDVGVCVCADETFMPEVGVAGSNVTKSAIMNGKKEKRGFFGLGRKSKADKPQYEGAMRDGKACGQVCRCRVSRIYGRGTAQHVALTLPLCQLPLPWRREGGCGVTDPERAVGRGRGFARGPTGTHTTGSGRTTACTDMGSLCGSKSRAATWGR